MAVRPIPNADTSSFVLSDGSVQESFVTSGDSEGNGGSGALTVGEVKSNPGELPDGPAPLTLGIFGQQIVEVALWQGNDDPMTTLEQPLTNAQFTAVEGGPSDAAWSGTGDATIISLLKAIYMQNATMIDHLAAIEANTDPNP